MHACMYHCMGRLTGTRHDRRDKQRGFHRGNAVAPTYTTVDYLGRKGILSLDKVAGSETTNGRYIRLRACREAGSKRRAMSSVKCYFFTRARGPRLDGANPSRFC